MGKPKVKIYCIYKELVDINKLVPHPKNNNVHPPEQIQLLSKLLKNHGWRAPITVSSRSGFIVRGHGKLQAAQLLKLKKVPVDYQNYESDAAEMADLSADNKIAELSFLDDDLTRELLHDIQAADTNFDLELAGFLPDELAEILEDGDIIGGGGNDDPGPGENGEEKPAERKRSSPIGSLIYRPTLNKTRTARFISVRKWNPATKDEDLKTIKEVKRSGDDKLAGDIADELAQVILDLVKSLNGFYITTPPSSCRNKIHFAAEIAGGLATRLGIEYIKIFSDRPRRKSSHPRHHAERGEAKIAHNPQGKFCLLVDDLATSGTTIEECAGLLGKYGMVLPVVWLYSEAKEGE